jgi:selenocysteine lyase/cysteine desulfurase
MTLDETRCVTDVGGGMVEYVSTEDFILKNDVTAREEPGTPNIPGSIAMGLIAELLLALDMEQVEQAEIELTRKLVERLDGIEGVSVVGATDLENVPRAGVVAFDVEGFHHGLVAAFLNDFHNVAVRNGCFCAQPYVQRMLKLDCDIEARYEKEVRCGDRSHVPGLVRASLGLYSTEEDIDALGVALEDLVQNAERIKAMYENDRTGTFHRIDCEPLPATFEVRGFVKEWLEA